MRGSPVSAPGLLALHRGAGNAAVSRMLERHREDRAAASLPVQRAVGFEFETTWQLAATRTGTGVPGTGSPLPLTAKKEITGTAGWSLHADVNRVLVAEFVTEPVDEDDVIKLVGILSDLESYTLGWTKASGIRAADGSMWVKVISYPAGDVYVKKGDPEMQAAPQMTAGFRLDRLIPLMRAMSLRRHEPGSRELLNKPAGEGTERLSRHMATAAYRAEAFCQKLATRTEPLAGIAVQVDPRMSGTLALLGLYARLGKEHAPLDYAKELSPLMARTNLGQLPNELRMHHGLLDGVLYVADIPKAEASTAKLFRAGFKKAGVPDVEFLGPTIQEWITGIQNGDDPLRRFSGDQMSNLGRMEPVGMGWKVGKTGVERSSKAQGIIIELRGMREGLPRDKWATIATHLLHYVETLNRSDAAATRYEASGAYPADAPAHADVGRFVS